MSIDIRDRARGAIWGQMIGDAACLGTHWIYDLEEMEHRFAKTDGFDAPGSSHYHAQKRPGEQTHYGDAALVMLESVSRLGHFDERDFGSHFVRFFGAADYRDYLDKSTRGTLANYRAYVKQFSEESCAFQNGADDDEGATVSRIAPVVVAHGNTVDWAARVEKATRVTQNNDRAVAYAQADANILRLLLQGASLHESLVTTEKWIQEFSPKFGLEIREKMELARTDSLRGVVEATLAFGQSCPLPKSFPSAIHAAIKHSESFRDAVLSTLLAGGDNASRAAMVGAWLGAALGYEAIPETWRAKLAARETVTAQTEALLCAVRL